MVVVVVVWEMVVLALHTCTRDGDDGDEHDGSYDDDDDDTGYDNDATIWFPPRYQRPLVSHGADLTLPPRYHSNKIPVSRS